MPTTFLLDVDWDRDGTWIDETAYLRRVRIRSGFARPGDPVADEGRCELTLDNTTGRFSPGNTEGLLYGKLLPRRPVKVSATDGTSTWVLFRGFIEHLAPDAGHWGSGLCTVQCVDGIALLARQRLSTTLADAKDVDQAVSDIVSGVYTPPATAYSDNGDSLTHVGRAWNPEQTTAHDALREVAEAVYGRFFVARDGTATLLTRTDLQDPSISAAATIGDPILAPYSTRLTATQPNHLIGYWPLWEVSGSTVYDYSGHEHDLTAYGVTWGQPGIGDDHTAAGLDGINDNIGGLSAALAAAFDGDEGTLLLWLKPENDAVWTDGQIPYLIRIMNGDGQSNLIEKRPAGELHCNRANVGVGGYSPVQTGTAWRCVALTWSVVADEARFFVGGAQIGTTLTGLAAWTSSTIQDDYSRIGSAGGARFWPGYLAHVALWDAALTPAEVAALAQV